MARTVVSKDQSMVAQKAMDILLPLYREEKVQLDEKTGRVVSSYSGKTDTVRQELLGKMSQEAAGLFIKGNGTYASCFLSVVNDYADGFRDGYVPGLLDEKDACNFYNRHKDLLVHKAETICEKFCMDFCDIPGFDFKDQMVKGERNQTALVKFVIDSEVLFLSKDVNHFRDELEKISIEKTVTKGSLRLRQGKTNGKPAERESGGRV